MKTTLAYVSGGSNLDPVRNLRLAARELRTYCPEVRFSRCFENAAVGFEGPPFTNFVAEMPLKAPPAHLRAELQRIERLCGRPDNAPRWAPRTMDLDILLFGDLVQEVPGLALPRPDLLKRSFMLGPLAELAPDLQHPTAGATMRELWARFDQHTHPLTPIELDLNES